MFRYLCRGGVGRRLRISFSREKSTCCSSPCYTYGLDSEEFRKRARAVVDFICKYNKELACRPLIPNVQPGFLRKTLPREPPCKPEKWDCIMHETYEKILPGIIPWQHPKFCGFHPTGNSYASILGDWLSCITASNGFSWSAGPAYTELEIIVSDWYAKAMSIPQFFFHESKRGGGVMLNTASECILTAMLAARTRSINKLKKCEPDKHDSCFVSRLVAYYSKEAHSGVERACKMCMVQSRVLESDENCALRGEVLEKAMQADVDKGLIPFFVVASLGTPSVFSCDNLAEIGPIICRFCAWLHVEASYAGAAFICPEFRPLMNGLEYSNSFSTSPHQWMLCHHDLALLYVKEKKRLIETFTIDPAYLQNEHTDRDYRNWCIPLSRRFRAMKLWVVLRDFGLEGVQEYLWNHMCLAKYFEELVKRDDRFEVVYETWFGVVCFRLCGSDDLNEKLVCSINQSNELFLTPTIAKCKYIIRFSVNYLYATESDICSAWEIIQKHACNIMKGDKTCEKKQTCPPAGNVCQTKCQPVCEEKPKCPPAGKVCEEKPKCPPAGKVCEEKPKCPPAGKVCEEKPKCPPAGKVCEEKPKCPPPGKVCEEKPKCPPVCDEKPKSSLAGAEKPTAPPKTCSLPKDPKSALTPKDSESDTKPVQPNTLHPKTICPLPKDPKSGG